MFEVKLADQKRKKTIRAIGQPIHCVLSRDIDLQKLRSDVRKKLTDMIALAESFGDIRCEVDILFGCSDGGIIKSGEILVAEKRDMATAIKIQTALGGRLEAFNANHSIQFTCRVQPQTAPS